MIRSVESVVIGISPDGSCRDDKGHVLACEFKCPLPGKKYTPDVRYVIPKYYIPQLLSEMVALQATELLYLSYTEETPTVFKVTFDQISWDIMTNELHRAYGKEMFQRQRGHLTMSNYYESALSGFKITKLNILEKFLLWLQFLVNILQLQIWLH